MINSKETKPKRQRQQVEKEYLPIPRQNRVTGEKFGFVFVGGLATSDAHLYHGERPFPRQASSSVNVGLGREVAA